MGQEQFAAIMPYISADLVGMIVKRKTYPSLMRLQSCITQSYTPLLSRRIQRSGNTARICCIPSWSRKKEQRKSNFPMCEEAQI